MLVITSAEIADLHDAIRAKVDTAFFLSSVYERNA